MRRGQNRVIPTLFGLGTVSTALKTSRPDHSITQVNAASPPPPLLFLLRSLPPNPSHFPSYILPSILLLHEKEQKKKQSLKEIQKLISSILHPEVNLFEVAVEKEAERSGRGGGQRSTLLSSPLFQNCLGAHP